MNEKKPWYKSKITLVSLITGVTLLGDYFTGWITGLVSPGQIEVVQTAAPAVAESIENAIKNGNVLTAVTGVANFVIAIWRVWFTDKKVEF